MVALTYPAPRTFAGLAAAVAPNAAAGMQRSGPAAQRCVLPLETAEDWEDLVLLCAGTALLALVAVCGILGPAAGFGPAAFAAHWGQAPIWGWAGASGLVAVALAMVLTGSRGLLGLRPATAPAGFIIDFPAAGGHRPLVHQGLALRSSTRCAGSGRGIRFGSRRSLAGDVPLVRASVAAHWQLTEDADGYLLQIEPEQETDAFAVTLEFVPGHRGARASARSGRVTSTARLDLLHDSSLL